MLIGREKKFLHTKATNLDTSTRQEAFISLFILYLNIQWSCL